MLNRRLGHPHDFVDISGLRFISNKCNFMLLYIEAEEHYISVLHHIILTL